MPLEWIKSSLERSRNLEEAMQNERQGGQAESLGDAELRAMQTLERELASYLQVTELAFYAIGLATSRMPELPVREVTQSCKVVTGLLMRLSNDLRSTALLACRGYAVQAVSLVSSMFEVAYTIAAIGSDEKLAQQWIEYDDPTRTFKDIPTLIRAGLRNLSVPNPNKQFSSEYLIYRQLCLAKHANPLFQRQLAYRLVGNVVESSNGPDTSEPAIKAACFALDHAAHLAIVALRSFVNHQLTLESRNELRRPLAALMAARQKLSDIAQSRGWGKDPFPGKWRV
jgi:hypothetical protein